MTQAEIRALMQDAACFCSVTGNSSEKAKLQLLSLIAATAVDATPGGVDGAIQYNNGGAFGGFGSFNDATSLVTLPGNLTLPAAGTIGFTGRSKIQSTADSALLLTNDAGTDFSLLRFGGAAATFPALKRSTTNLQARLADDSAFTRFSASGLDITAAANATAEAVTGYSITGSGTTAMYSLAGTLNTTGVTHVMNMVLTQTAVGANSSFARYLGGAAGATDRIQLAIDGSVNAANGLNFCNAAFANINAAMGGGANGIRTVSTYGWTWTSQAAGSVSVFAGTVDLGITREAAGILQVNNGTAGTYRDISARIVRTTPAFTVGTLPAAGTAGRRTYVTDALAPAYGAAVAAGGAVVTPVFDNGAAWVVG